MMLKNTSVIYGTVAKFFHCLMAALIIVMFFIAFTMINIPALRLIFNLNKATSLLIFGLLMLKLTWLFINNIPKLPPFCAHSAN